MKNLSEYVKRDSSGNVNIKATLEAAKADLLEFAQKEGATNGTYEATIDEVLSGLTGKTNKDYVVNEATRRLAISHEDYAPVKAGIMEFLKNSKLYEAPKGRSEKGFHKVAQDQAAE